MADISNPPSLASETTAPTADEILGALTWARDEANAQCMNARLDRKSGNGGPWDSYEGVLRWIASALPLLLADRDRVDWLAENTKTQKGDGMLIAVMDESWEVGETVSAGFNGWSEGIYGEGPTLRRAIDAARLRPERPEGAE